MNRLSCSRSTVACASVALAVSLSAASSVQAANLLANPTFESPPSINGVDTTIAGWTLVNDIARANFANHTPGGTRSVWLKTFEKAGGDVEQTVGITAGASYTLSSFNYFEASYPNTLANVFLSVAWLDASNSAVGSPTTLTIAPETVTTTNVWTPYSTTAVAPTGATQALVSFGWSNGGTVDGAQSAFIDDVVFDGPGTPPPPISNDWVPTGSGDWNVGSNWLSGNVPNGIGVPANFLGSITAPHTVYSDTAVTAGSLKFNNANTYVIAGAGSLTLDVATGNATIDVLAGSHKINLPFRLNDNTVATVAAGTTLTIADPLTLANGATLAKAGAGTLEILSTVTTVGSAGGFIAVAAGSANLRTDVGPTTTLQTTGGTMTVFATQHVAAVSVGSGSTFKIDSTGPAKVVRTGALLVNGKFDIGDNGVITTASTSDIRAAILAAFNGGAYNGASGIGTSATTAGRGIGYASRAELGNPATFLGESLSGQATLVRYTLLGDFDLNGAVDFNDLLALAKNYNGTTRQWYQGDADYNGSVDFNDLLALAKNYNGVLAAGSAELPGGAAFAGDLRFVKSLVPEPATLTLLGLGAAAMIRRRRA